MMDSGPDGGRHRLKDLAVAGFKAILGSVSGSPARTVSRLFICDEYGLPYVDAVVVHADGTQHADYRGIVEISCAYVGCILAIHDCRTWQLLCQVVVWKTTSGSYQKIVVSRSVCDGQSFLICEKKKSKKRLKKIPIFSLAMRIFNRIIEHYQR